MMSMEIECRSIKMVSITSTMKMATKLYKIKMDYSKNTTKTDIKSLSITEKP